MENQSKEKYCVICGDVCPRTKRGLIRKNAKYCCKDCENEGKRLNCKRYFAERYNNDEEWRAKRVKATGDWIDANRERFNAQQVERYHARKNK